MIPNRLKLVAATGLLIGGLGAAALPRAFAAQMADATPTPAASAPATTPAAGPEGKVGGWHGGAPSAALAQFFGISTTDLQTAFRNGQTLAQIAAAHGKSTADLKAFLTAQLKTRLDAAVAAGKMTAQQEQTALTNASSRLDQMINAKPGSRPGGAERGFGRGFGGGWLQPVAGFLGISQSDLSTALQNGQTLAQIAQAHGKTAADLKAFLLNQASSRIDALLNANLSHQGGHGFGRGPGARGTPGVTPTATPGA
jgi:uncharacterized protein YidB (DUF937 family)